MMVYDGLATRRSYRMEDPDCGVYYVVGLLGRLVGLKVTEHVWVCEKDYGKPVGVCEDEFERRLGCYGRSWSARDRVRSRDRGEVGRL
ncbi:unnamed protein product [Dovyalis caffra]|uniref:Uncharacterized protein n=1 Tax=Dovyalis caffra TaxID=77055 RepID=A0AAV1R4N5_9ROSI|nr:unnamed protein product [Dovyalis caffra]